MTSDDLDDSSVTTRLPARPVRRRSSSAVAQESVRKPVNTLAIVPQSRRITPLFRKSYNVMLYLAQEQGLDQEIYRAPVSDVLAGLAFDSHDTALVKKHLRAMASTAVEWQSPTTGEGATWAVSGLIGHAELKQVRGQTWLEWSYSVKLRHELLQPSVYARLSLQMMSQLRSHGGIALYEICSRYRGVGRTSRQAWSWWRPVLSGKPETDKTRALEYRFFKRDVLKTAIAEVNAVTDIEVELVEFRAGRFISDLQFLVRQKAQAALALATPPRPVNAGLVLRAGRLGIDEDRAEELLAEFDEDALTSGLDALERRIASAFPEPLRDAYRYLKSLMPGETARLQESTRVEAGRAPATPAAPVEPAPRRQQRWTDEWLRRRRHALMAELAALPMEQQAELSQALLVDMESRSVHPSIRKRLQQSGWQHQMVVAEMVRYYAVGTLGDGWDKPSPEQLLAVASTMEEP